MGRSKSYHDWLQESARTKRISSFDREVRVEEFKLARVPEEFVDLLNWSLLDLDGMLSPPGSVSFLPSILIISPPRSGSTFLNQKLAQSGELGYVSNLMARFHAAPLVGAYLQSLLISDEMKTIKDLKSIHGKTHYIFEPHEFGYFWGHYLPFSGDSHAELDPELSRERQPDLGQRLNQISDVFGKPTVLKCSIGPFVLDTLLRDPRVLILTIKRERDALVRSILRTREARMGSVQEWWSVRPRNWLELSRLSPEDQVWAQVESIEDAINLSAAKNSERFFHVGYQELVDTPERVVSEFLGWLRRAISVRIEERVV